MPNQKSSPLKQCTTLTDFTSLSKVFQPYNIDHNLLIRMHLPHPINRAPCHVPPHSGNFHSNLIYLLCYTWSADRRLRIGRRCEFTVARGGE